MKLLVVEDEPGIASLLARGLRAHGYEVQCASTGQQALRRGIQPGLALVILDLKPPDLDGLEVLAGLRARGRSTSSSWLGAMVSAPGRNHGAGEQRVVKPLCWVGRRTRRYRV